MIIIIIIIIIIIVIIFIHVHCINTAEQAPYKKYRSEKGKKN